MGKEVQAVRVDRVVLLGENRVAEIMDIDEIKEGRIITSGKVIPATDAVIYNGDEGLIYVIGANLEYIKEIEHLAEVEKNIIVEQAFLYPGRNMPGNKPNPFVWVVTGLFFLLAVVGMFN